MRTREHPALITPDENILILNQMRFEDELRSFSEHLNWFRPKALKPNPFF